MARTADGDSRRLGREAIAGARWPEAFELLSAARAVGDLAGEDLEELGNAALLLGREGEAIGALEQAHESHLAVGQIPAAARVAVWLTLHLMMRGDVARGSGWFARARRLLEEHHEDCVERGYLQMPLGLQLLGSGDPRHALPHFQEAMRCGDRFEDVDLATLGRLGAGQALVGSGDQASGTELLDEAMVSVTVGGVSPVTAGIVYCAVIETCHAIFDVRRAQEWTAALSDWCEEHPEVIAYRGQCLTYRSEIMRLHGAWTEALREAERAEALLSRPPVHPAVGSCLYERAELHRLRGEFGEAEAAYREAARWGRHPEPGLALLRLAEGRGEAAAASIRRALQEADHAATRCRLLPAAVAIMLAVGDTEAARANVRELTALSDRFDAALVRATAAQGEGALLLAEGDPGAALSRLRRAWSEWQSVEAPYEAARARVLLGRACRALNDLDSAELEEDAARVTFEQLGALPDLAALDAVSVMPVHASPGGFTPREFEVLRLLARGRSNRDIAAELVISEKTVARHVSNILAKAAVPSRTAAVAYAHDRGLL